MTGLHHVTVTAQYDSDGEELTPDVVFECRGDRASECHKWPDCSCESWDDLSNGADENGHPVVDQGECWMQGWFDHGAHEYDGDDADPAVGDYGLPAGLSKSGAIDVSFQGEYLNWRFAA